MSASLSNTRQRGQRLVELSDLNLTSIFAIYHANSVHHPQIKWRRDEVELNS